MHYTSPVIVLTRNGITERISRFIEEQFMRHQVPLKNEIGKIDSSYSECIKLNSKSNFVKSKLYNMTRGSEKILEMISLMMASMSVQSKSFCTLSKYRLTKT